jgi:uncharacterized protein CbrC (UPF0167 family)
MYDETKVKLLSDSFKKLAKNHELRYSISTQKDWISCCCETEHFKGDILKLIDDIQDIAKSMAKLEKDKKFFWIDLHLHINKNSKVGVRLYQFINEEDKKSNDGKSLVEKYR